MDLSKVKVIPTELGGGFGGKNNVYLEPLAVMLSKKGKRPVKMVMDRDEVFRATGPTSGTNVKVKMGCTRDGRITAAQAELNYQSGAYAGSSLPLATITVFTRYDLENVSVVGHDVTTNRPKVAAYRAPGAPMVAFGVETVIDEMARECGIDCIDFRLLNAAKEGTQTHFGPKLGPIGYIQTLERAKVHAHMSEKLGPNQGRGVATGFWFTLGAETSATVNVGEDGTATLIFGTVDVTGGSRSAFAMIVAEELGIPYEKVRTMSGDTSALGFNFMTAGSRGTAAGSMAAVTATRKAIARMCEIAARKWEVEPDQVVWEDGKARPAGANVGDFAPMSVAELAKEAAWFGGTIAGHAEINVAQGGPGFGTHIVDVEVDRRTGAVKVLRYTLIQDAGKAVYPEFIEGQFQGGAVQGIGTALNEEYIYNDKGVARKHRVPRLPHPGRLRRAVHQHGNRRGAEPGSPLRHPRHRRSADHPAAAGHRQRDPRRYRYPHARPSDVAAEGAQGAEGSDDRRRRRARHRGRVNEPSSKDGMNGKGRRNCVGPFLCPQFLRRQAPRRWLWVPRSRPGGRD